MRSDAPPIQPTSPSDRALWGLVAGLALLALLLAPWTGFRHDLAYWFRWAAATGGTWPAGVYTVDCDYPPLVPYLLTAWEALRLALGLPATLQGAGVALLKLPGIAMWAAGVAVCRYGLVPGLGTPAARAAAWLYALCLPVWFNAAVWGQADAGLALGLVTTLAAALAARPGLAGAALGLTLAWKLQAVVAVPALAVYAARAYGARAVGVAIAALVGAWAIAIAPMVAVGGGAGVSRAYMGAVDHFPFATVGAYNLWFLPDLVHQVFGTGLGPVPDTRTLGGPFTLKRLGLGAFAAYVAVLAVDLARRPGAARMAMAATLTGFGMFMLATQMHERYLVPAAAMACVAAVAAPWARPLAIGLAVTATANQVGSMGADLGLKVYTLAGLGGWLALTTAVANVALFGWASWRHLGLSTQGPGEGDGRGGSV